MSEITGYGGQPSLAVESRAMTTEKPKLTNNQITMLQEEHDYHARECNRLRVSHWEEYVDGRIREAVSEQVAQSAETIENLRIEVVRLQAKVLDE